MRKRIIRQPGEGILPTDENWLNLEQWAEVEITSEDHGHPIESAILPGHGSTGWRAAKPGKQTIRIVFLQPKPVRRIWLQFVESNMARTQEYLLRWSPDRGSSYQEIVRQQWNFDPKGATTETEDHHVRLSGVTVLELNITPDISGKNAIASLAQLRLA